jgi:transcriptional regulator MraZ
MLLGEHEHTIDDKSRLTLPARFRQAFADGVVLTRGMDGCLYAYPRDHWERTASEIGSLDDLSPEGRVMKRFFFAGAAVGEPDRQGRIAVPATLSRHAGLGRDVVVAGVYDHLEIWDRKAWEEQLRKVEGSVEDVARRLASTRD